MSYDRMDTTCAYIYHHSSVSDDISLAAQHLSVQVGGLGGSHLYFPYLVVEYWVRQARLSCDGREKIIDMLSAMFKPFYPGLPRDQCKIWLTMFEEWSDDMLDVHGEGYYTELRRIHHPDLDYDNRVKRK